ncbi:hypothetical protein QMU85_002183 [Photobacterium damselae]|nr:hypothetical protein [Photobacterium damselae]
MKTNRIRFISGFLFLAILPTYCAANVTFDSLKLETALNTSNIPSNLNWQTNNPIPNSSNNPSQAYTRYTVSNGVKRLQRTDTHICVVGSAGGEYRRGLKGLNVVVEPRSGYWYLTAKHDSGGSNNWGAATCWTK